MWGDHQTKDFGGSRGSTGALDETWESAKERELTNIFVLTDTHSPGGKTIKR